MRNDETESLSDKFDRFKKSGAWGSETDPETGLIHYKGSAGPGTVEFAYDPDTEEVINGQVRKIDYCS